jgi:hypothetical protein
LNLQVFALVERIFLRQHGSIGTRKLAQSNFQYFFEARQVARAVGCCKKISHRRFSLDDVRNVWEIPKMKTLTVDDQKRIRIPDAKPRQVFAYENSGNGRLTLTLVKAETQEPFPPGSLKKYVTPERDAEMLDLLKGCSLEVSD